MFQHSQQQTLLKMQQGPRFFKPDKQNLAEIIPTIETNAK